MRYRYSGFIGLIHIIGDLFVLNLSFLFAHWLLASGVELEMESPLHPELLLFYNVAWIILTLIFRAYLVGRAERITQTLVRYYGIMFIHMLLVVCHINVSKDYQHFSECFLLTYFGFAMLIFCWKSSVILALQKYRKRGYNYRNIVIMGYGELAEDLKAFFRLNPEYGYRFLGVFDNNQTGNGIVGKMEDLRQFVEEQQVDEIYCCLPYVRYRKVKELVDFGEENLIKVKLIADFRGFSFKGVELERYDHIPVLNISNIPLDNIYNQFLKRTFDIAFSCLIIVFVFSWLFPIIALCIKLESAGPVFFKQKRSGLKNNSFWCYKFRSMRVNVDSDKIQATKGDSRITKVGAFLRKTSLDELPQFFNVLMGDMSVVGPRPHMLSHTEEYSKQINKFMSRHFVKPGITGLAQAKGFRGETECIGMMKNRIRMDRFYVRNWTLIFDIRIIILTVQSMMKGQEKAY